ncbi:MAG: FixH family protein, partial [Salinivirgaceae bacterium]|nr:FixH family protein [Salinivirgaceae bacterium]
GGIEATDIVVDALPEGQIWLKNFKVDDQTYFLSLVNPTDWKTGTNEIVAYVSQKSQPITTPYALAAERFTIEIDPRMPDMGNHTSPDNTPLTRQADGSYQGTINLTMTGLWRIHLTVKDANGNIVAGGDTENDGFSSLYWDVTI